MSNSTRVSDTMPSPLLDPEVKGDVWCEEASPFSPSSRRLTLLVPLPLQPTGLFILGWAPPPPSMLPFRWHRLFLWSLATFTPWHCVLLLHLCLFGELFLFSCVLFAFEFEKIARHFKQAFSHVSLLTSRPYFQLIDPFSGLTYEDLKIEAAGPIMSKKEDSSNPTVCFPQFLPEDSSSLQCKLLCSDLQLCNLDRDLQTFLSPSSTQLMMPPTHSHVVTVKGKWGYMWCLKVSDRSAHTWNVGSFFFSPLLFFTRLILSWGMAYQQVFIFK